MQPTQPTVKPGFHTSEFYVSIIVSVLTAVLPYLTNGSRISTKIIGALVAVLPIINYTTQRSNIKQAALNNPPLRTINMVKQPTNPTIS